MILGDNSTFGIRYIKGWATLDESNTYANLNLCLQGDIIGNYDEAVFIPTWSSLLKKIPTQLKESKNRLDWSVLSHLSSLEQFETLNKANQLPKEYSSEFSYLPVIEHKYWLNSRIQLDESIDDYLIFCIPFQNNLKFVWKNISNTENQVKSMNETIENVISTIKKCNDIVDKDQYYKVKNTQDNKR